MSKRVSEAVAPTVTPNAGGESAPLKFTESGGDLAPRGNGPAIVPADSAERAALVASKIDDSSSEVIRWGNGEPASGDEDTTPAVPTPKPKAEPAPKTKPDDSPAEEAAPEDAESAETVAAKPRVDADKRRQILESLDKEKNRVEIENRIKEEQTKREAAEAKLAEFEKSSLGKKIKAIAAQHGMSVEDLKDKMLIGADDVLDKEEAPAAKPAEKDPEVVALLKWKAEKEKAEDDAKIQQSVDRVREQLKDTDLPMIDAFDAHGRVLVKAHKGWVAGGRKGTVAEFVPTAAEIVEDELKAERPNAAKRLYAQAAAEEPAEEAEPAPRPTPRPAMGKRQAARPGTKPAPLPFDPEERDRAIKKRYGWT